MSPAQAISHAQARRRLRGFAVVLMLCFLGLAAWLGEIQIRRHATLKALAADNLQRKTLRPGRRGSILDARGFVLAASEPTKTVVANPSFIFTDHARIASTLAPLLQRTPSDLLNQILPRIRTNQAGRRITNSYVVLKQDVALQDWLQITQAMATLKLDLPATRMPSSLRTAVSALRTRAITGVEDHHRRYPNQTLAAHVLGFVAGGETETDHGRVFEDHGVTGIELTLDADLTGVHGWRQGGESIASSDGLSAVLTIDATVQHIVEDELQRAFAKYSPTSICCVVVRPRTGDILALANLPTFNPNRPGSEVANQKNHAVSDLFEPGSTFKIVTITTALEDGRLRLDDTVFCENGRWLYGGRYLHDHHPYGILNFATVVSKSSNIGTAKAALRLGPARLHQTVTNFGFGCRTGIPLPAEAPGVVYPTNLWNKLSITRIPIGHEVLASPLQMVLAMAAIANGGRLMQPRLIDRLLAPDGRIVRVFPTNEARRVASEATCREMLRPLQAVASEEGTARAAQLDYYTVAGKTGTAEKFAEGTYKSGKYYASFVGCLPASDPELAIIVGIDEPDRKVGHMGGAVAAPVFKAIAERTANYLRIPPDQNAEPDLDGRNRHRTETGAKWVTRNPNPDPGTALSGTGSP